MKRGNYVITRKYSLEMLSCPITMKKISKTSGDVLFYNSYCGSLIVEELKVKVTGRFDFIAAFKWIGQERKVKVKQKKKVKILLLYLSV